MPYGALHCGLDLVTRRACLLGVLGDGGLDRRGGLEPALPLGGVLVAVQYGELVALGVGCYWSEMSLSGMPTAGS